MLAIIGLSAFATMSLLVMGLLRRSFSTLETRLESFRQRAVIMGRGETDLSLPFGERVIRPAIEGLARAGTSILPASTLANIEKQLVMAGSPMTSQAFVATWVGTASVLAFVVLFAVVLIGGTIGIQQAFAVLMFGSIGLLIPMVWLRGRVKARQKVILKALPDALDLITTCVEAGLGLDAALAKVAEQGSGPLAEEMSQAMREIALGRRRREALAEMGARTGVEDLIAFIHAIIQAEQLGVGITQALRVQSEQLRTRRRQRAEKAAHEAPVKMLFPLVFLIFPAFMIVVLGPAIIQLSESFLFSN